MYKLCGLILKLLKPDKIYLYYILILDRLHNEKKIISYNISEDSVVKMSMKLDFK